MPLTAGAHRPNAIQMPQLDVQQTAGAAGLFHGTIVIAQLAPRQGVSRIRHAPLWEDWGGLGRTENWGWWKWGARNEKYGGGGWDKVCCCCCRYYS